MQDASLKCQTQISSTKPNCGAEILAYRVSVSLGVYLCMCTCVCTCAWVCERVCIHTDKCEHVCMHIYVYEVCVCWQKRLSECVYVYTNEQECLKAMSREQKKERDAKFWGTAKWRSRFVHSHTKIHTYIDTRTYTEIKYINKHTHTHPTIFCR